MSFEFTSSFIKIYKINCQWFPPPPEFSVAYSEAFKMCFLANWLTLRNGYFLKKFKHIDFLMTSCSICCSPVLF